MEVWEQARLVAVWFTRDSEDPDRCVLHVLNGSDQPVRWVLVRSTRTSTHGG